jgi:hypothetical protein
VMSRTLVKPRAMVAGLVLLGTTLTALVLLGPLAEARASSASVPGLPDNRGYEKVSPTNNADGNVYMAWPLNIASEGGHTEQPYKAAPDGDTLAYIGMPSEEGGIGREGNTGNQYVARRRADGDWEATNVTPSSDEFFTIPVYQGFSSDLSRGFLTTNAGTPLVPGAPAAHYRVPYVRDFETGTYETLLPAVPPNRTPTESGTSEFGAYEIATGYDVHGREPVFSGSSKDFSHILYMANDALTANAVDGGEEDNNLYDFHNGGLTLVNILPDGSPEPNAVFGGQVIRPASRESNAPDFSHVISEDGNRIFWTGQGANRNIYMREGGTRTVQVDAGVGGGGQFWTATADGSKALFTKGGDLYEYDVADGQTTDLVPGGEIQGIVGTSDDLSYIYFVADAILAPGGEQGSCNESEGLAECGLYVLHKGEHVKFIATLSSRDNNTNPTSFYNHDGDWQGGLADKEAEVTPDGRQVLFSSVRPLTGYESNGTEQLFVYEFEGSKLGCISCDPAGESPTHGYSAFLPVSHQDTDSLHWMADDGSRVFFDSVDALVSQDTNGQVDVYEWERDGVGSCADPEGCIYLLSGGTAAGGAYLIDASANGDDVFFTTRAQLVEEDQNENIDAYDAHVGAAIPPAASQCTGTGCQGVPSAPPVFSTPASVTYVGVGNFAQSVKTKRKATKAKTKSKKHKPRKPAKKPKKAKKSSRRHRDKGHGSAVSYGRSK